MIDFLFFNGIIYHKHIKNMAQSKPVQKKEDTVGVIFRELAQWGRDYLVRLGVNLRKSLIWIAQGTRHVSGQVVALRGDKWWWLLKLLRGFLAIIGMIVLVVASIDAAVVKSLFELEEPRP